MVCEFLLGAAATHTKRERMGPKRKRRAAPKPTDPELIVFDRRHHTFRCAVGGYTCSGLHAFLQAVFYPGYQSTWRPGDMAKAHADAPGGGGKSAFARGGRRFARGADAAMRRGKRVDAAIKKWVASPEIIPERAGSLARNLIAAMKTKWKWTPLESQGVIGISDARLATAFDFFGSITRKRTSSSSTVLAQVKQGFEGYWKESNGQMLAAPLQTIPACERTKAILQILLEAHLFEHTRKSRPDFLYVVLTNSTGVERVVVRSPDAKDQALIDTWVPAAELAIQAAVNTRRQSYTTG